VARWQSGRCSLFGPADIETDRNNNFTFARDGRGRVWLANGSFLGWYADGKIVRGPVPPEPGMLVAPSRSGGIWISTAHHLLKLDGEHLSVVSEEPDWLAMRSGVRELFEDTNGVLWIATHRHGLFRLNGKKTILMLASSELVSSVMEDSENNIWAAVSGAGLTRLRREAFVMLGTRAGLPDNVSLSVCDDDTGAIWCANRRSGVVRYQAGTIKVFEISDEVRPYATSVCPDRAGNIWVGSVEGLHSISAHAPDSLHRQPEVTGIVNALLCAQNGDLWVGSGDNRLGRLHAGTYQLFSKADGFPEVRVDAIAEDARGIIWVCTNRELFEFVEGKFIRRLSLEENHAGELLALHVDSRGSLWLGTTNGLLLHQSDQFKLIGLKEGLPGDTISQILEDDFGHLWCGGRLGLFSVALNDLYEIASGRISRLSGTTFGDDEGIPGSSSPTGRQPMAWKARDGRLWFASSEGLIGIDPTAAALERQPLPVFIDQVLIDNKRAKLDNQLVVPPGARQVEFGLIALNYTAPEKVRLRHQLIGFDPDWVENNRERTATYVHLPPGSYRMRVIAANQDGVWTDTGPSLAVIVVPAWWQQWWFIAALVLCFTALVAGIVRFWSHRRLKGRLEKLQREHALDMERARIARDLHDELGGSLTQIRMLADRLKRHASTPEALSVAGQLATRTRRVARELESIVWTVSPKNNTWDRLAAFIGQYSLRFFRDTDITCTVHGIELVPVIPLRPDQQHHILAIIKETLNNILKHAHASRVTVTVKLASDSLELEIDDDGTGFDLQKSEQPARNGLTNMRARAREIGSQLEIHTAPGKSTKISLRIPVSLPDS
jgi:signal transduction histidine kinase/ligand-binding sensor domain-containing protein